MKKKLFFLIAACMAIGSTAMAYDFSAVAPSGQTLYYNISGSTVTVTYPSSDNYVPYDGHIAPTGDLIIPSSVIYYGTTYTVTSIGQSAFSHCSDLTSVTIPNSITLIGQSAFSYCSDLTSVTIPNSITLIGQSAFFFCSGLTSVTIPNSVTSIGSSAFSFCSSLTSVIIPNSVTSIGDYAFREVRHIEYYGSATGSPWGAYSINGVTEGDFVYSDVTKHKLTAYLGTGGAVSILSTVDTIGEYAFNNCTSLTSITIPNSVTSIGNSAFSGCSNLDNVNYTGTIAQWCNIFFSDFSSNPTLYAHSLNINGNPITNLVIPNSVTSIGDYAFDGCSGLTAVSIPNSVTSIGYYAFSGCSGLTSVSIPNSVTSIGNYAFRGVRHIEYYGSATGSPWGAYSINGITEGDFVYSDVTKHKLTAYLGTGGAVTIPSTVDSIGDYAFYNCTGLTSITIPNNVTSISNYAFSGCSGLTSVTIPNSVTSIGNGAFSGCSGLTAVSIPNSVTSIGNYVFSSCSSLTSVSIPNSVTSIGNGAFNGCSGLTSVTIPNSITSIGSSAFSGCSSLTSVIIPNSVTSIGNGAFNGCSGLTSVTIPNSITSIGSSAFSGCSSLTSVIIPNSVTSIGDYAFREVRHIEYYGSATGSPWGACSMNGFIEGDFVYSDTTKHNLTAYVGMGGAVSIPNSVTSIRSGAFSNCNNLTSINIPNSVTSIGQSAFSGCTGLTSVLFNADSCISAGSNNCPIFNSCNNLTSITFGNNVKRIPSYLCSGCSGLTSVAIPSSITTIGISAFDGCSGLTSVIFNADSCISDGSYEQPIFNSCNNLTSITFGNDVKRIPSYFCTNCNNLTSVTIPTKVTSIGDYAFVGCSGLTSVLFNADSCILAGSNNFPIFNGCNNLTSITFGDNVKCIPSYLCYGRSGLISVIIPNSVTTIGNSAFYNCSGLTSVIFNADSCISAGGSSYSSSFHNCGNITNITFGDNVRRIPSYLCYGCSGLTSITIPHSVTTIGDYAFRDCSGLTSVTSLASIAPLLGTDAFSGVPTNIDVHIPCGSQMSYYSRWSYFSNFIEASGFSFSATSADQTMGQVIVLSQPSCQAPTAVIHATAISGYRFDHWSDNNLDNPRTLSLTSDTAIIGYFSAEARDTVYVHDTVYIHDTMLIYDTIYIHDTVYVGIDEVETLDAKIYQRDGRIVVESGDGETLGEVRVFDVMGRMVAGSYPSTTALRQSPSPDSGEEFGWRATFEVPGSGIYIVKIGDLPAKKIVVIR